jgi:hypothetical protein
VWRWYQRHKNCLLFDLDGLLSMRWSHQRSRLNSRRVICIWRVWGEYRQERHY